VTQKREEESAKNTSSTQTNKAHLTAADIEHFKQMLLIIRREIAGNVSEIEGEALKASDGDISNMPIHMAKARTVNIFVVFIVFLLPNLPLPEQETVNIFTAHPLRTAIYSQNSIKWAR